MTTYAVEAYELVLYDMYPGPVHVDVPQQDHDGNAFTNADHFNVATGLFEPGYKVAVKEPTLGGWSILTYLQYNAGGVTPLAVGHMAVLESGNSWYGVTNEGDSCLVNVPPAVALAAITDTYWGFFWTGGPCPQSWVSALATATISTNSTAAIGPVGLADCSIPDRVGLCASASAVNAVGFLLAAITST